MDLLNQDAEALVEHGIREEESQPFVRLMLAMRQEEYLPENREVTFTGLVTGSVEYIGEQYLSVTPSGFLRVAADVVGGILAPCQEEHAWETGDVVVVTGRFRDPKRYAAAMTYIQDGLYMEAADIASFNE
jgi:hypothetical protein